MAKLLKKKTTLFRPLVLSRHPSHNIFRAKFKMLPLFPCRSVIRFGSSTEVNDTVTNGGNRVEVNTIEAIKNSANKLLMKQCFMDADIKTAKYGTINLIKEVNEQGLDIWAIEDAFMLNFPIVAKAYYGSKGKGNTLIKSLEEWNQWIVGKNLNNYLFEKYHNYGLEFRLHITEDGCFYTCRKALKSDCPPELKWRHHDDTCVWFLENNPEFKKPNSWDDIVADCVKALKAIGADILSFDVKVQAKPNKDGYQDYILLECNSASSMGSDTGELSICAQKYIEIIPKVIVKKLSKLNK